MHEGTSPFPRYEWPEGKSSAFCFTVDVDAESPYLWGLAEGGPKLLGQMEQRLFGPRAGIWRSLDLLDRHAVKATFFVPGLVARNHPALLPAFAARGHEIGLHGYFHEIAAETEADEFSRALDESLALFKSQAGIVPKGFRSPAWEMTPSMLAEVRRRGLYDSSLMGFDHPYTIDGVTEVPVQWAVDDAIYFKFTGGFRNLMRKGGSSFNVSSNDLGISLLRNNRAKEIETRFGATNFSCKENQCS